jgi:hypothetical protein
MSVVRLALWEEFIDALTKNPPESRIVQLTFSVRYSSRASSDTVICAWYVTRDGFFEFVEGLYRVPGYREIPPRMQKVFEERRKELEGLGFKVESGRRRSEEGGDV